MLSLDVAVYLNNLVSVQYKMAKRIKFGIYVQRKGSNDSNTRQSSSCVRTTASLFMTTLTTLRLTKSVQWTVSHNQLRTELKSDKSYCTISFYMYFYWI